LAEHLGVSDPVMFLFFGIYLEGAGLQVRVEAA
jgi:hypothetical protein